VRNYLNHKTGKRERLKSWKMPSAKKVFIHLHREELRVAAEALDTATEIGYVGAHSSLVSKRMKVLTLAEKQNLKEHRKTWVVKGPPLEAWRRYVNQT
jgi:hypothetical protein